MAGTGKSQITIGRRRAERRETLAGLGFILPSLIGFIIFILIPVVMSLGISFCDWNFLRGWGAMKFVGLRNYINMFSDNWFFVSFRNNIIFTAVTIPLLIIFGLVMGEIVNRHVFGGKAIRVMIFIPYIASIVAICTVWQVMLQPSYGPINSALRSIGIDNPPRWLVDQNWALVSVMMIYIWTQIGYYVAVYMAGLKNVPVDIYEAATIDGASSVRQFFSITVPMVKPTTFFLATMGIIGSFKVFDIISVLTNGGPGNSTSVMAFYIYRSAFEEFKMGYASALAWALFIVIFLITMIQWKFQKNFTNE